MGNARKSLVVVGMVAAGLVGGLVARWLPAGPAPQAAEGAAAGAAAAKVLRAESFVLVDADGKEIGTLGSTAEGTALLIKGKDGKVRAGLGVTPRGYGGLTIGDADGRPRVTVGCSSSRASVLLFNAEGQEGMTMGVGPVVAGHPEQADIAILGPNGRIRLALGVGQDGKACGWDLLDEDGKPRLGATVSADGPALALKDPDGHVVWQAWQQAKQEQPKAQ